jgi:Domain of unknown function (DUF4340)
MKGHSLTIAVLVLAALTGVLYWSQHHKSTESSAEASSETPPKILSLNESDITNVDLKKGAGDVILSKDNSGTWSISAPKPLRADQSSVRNIVSTLSSLSADRLLEEKAGDLKSYGLNQPTLEVSVTEKNNKKEKLLVGDNTPTGSAAYAKLDGDPRVFTIASYTKNTFDKSANDLRDKRLLPVDSDKLSRVELIAKKQDIEFGRSKDEWQIVKPKPLRADAMRVEDLVRALQNATMDLGSSDDTKKAAAEFASATPIATAKLTDSSGTQQLELRKKKDEYYAKSTAVDGVYKVSSQLGQDLDKSLDDFRNKKLFDFGFSDPQKIDLHDGSKAYSLSRSGQDWSADGKKMDNSTVNSLIDKLRDLSASKFVDSGFTTPIFDASVTSNDGKRTEKVLIAKNGNDYVAKRENEAGLYKIEAPAYSELEKAAAELKPATQQPTAK